MKKKKKHLRKTFKEAELKKSPERGKNFKKSFLQEYIGASQVLGQSPFFLPEEDLIRG